MAGYVARRLLTAIPTIVGVTLVVFILLRVMPGDVAEMILRGPEGAGGILDISIEQLREDLGLNRPLYVQYFSWLGDVVTGDFGESLYTGRPVLGEILHRFPITLQLAVMTEVLALLLGIPLGIAAAVHRDTWIDYALRVSSMFFLAIPNFWLGLIILLMGLRLFDQVPPIGYHVLWKEPVENLTQLIWPAIVLASQELGRIGRMTRSSMLEVLGEDYIRTARAKGLVESRVLVGHALRNALIPVVTFSSLTFGYILGGVVVLERVFSIPGVGSLFLESLKARDYTLLQALITFFAVGFIIVNLIVDLMYGFLDPRIRRS